MGESGRPTAAPISVAVYGATGRMGRAVTELLARDYSAEAQLVAAIGSGQPLEALADADVIIDFSLPDGTNTLLGWLRALSGKPPVLVSGTTGLGESAFAEMETLAASTRVMQANNFSAGIAALNSILEFAAPILSQLNYTPVMTEAHHQHKMDAPSGTAKTLGETLESAFPTGVDTHAIRAGEVIGKHDITFYGRSDEISISHDARDRTLFARGAIEAALWLCRQPAGSGLYTMRSYFRERFLGNGTGA